MGEADDMVMPFGKWAPDAYDLNATGLVGNAKGVLPGLNSYRPWPKLQAFSAALGGACKGGILARQTNGTYVLYAGTTDKLLKFAGATSWDDLSGATYAVPDDEFWSATQFGANVIFANGSDNIQSGDVDAGTSFADLAGSPPKARIVKTVGDYLMLGRTSNFPTGLEWSGLNDPTFWTHGQRSSDYQQFPDGGFVTGITGLDAGMIFQEEAIRRFGAVVTNDIFEFARIEDGQGCIAPNSLAVVNGTAYFFSRAGFRKIGASTGFVSQPVGLDIVDRFFQASINTDRLAVIRGAADPLRPRIFFLAPSVGNVGDLLDVCLCYDITRDQWTHADIGASYILPAATPGYTLEDLDTLYGTDLDSDIPISLDSPILQGGVPYVAGFDSDQKLGFFNGGNMAAVVQTAEFQAIPGKRAFVQGFRAITDAAAVVGRVAARESPQGIATWTAASPIRPSGKIPVRSSGRLHRFELSIAEDASWTHLEGVDFGDGDLVAAGQR